MSNFSNGIVKSRVFAKRNWMFEIEPHAKAPLKTLEEVSDDVRLRRVLQRAVMRDHAPKSLIDSIRNSIR